MSNYRALNADVEGGAASGGSVQDATGRRADRDFRRPIALQVFDGLAGRIETPPIGWVHERYGLDGITGKCLDVLLDPAHRADAMRTIPEGPRPT